MVAPSEELKLLWFIQDVGPQLQHICDNIEALAAQLEEQLPGQSPQLRRLIQNIQLLAAQLERWQLQ